MQLFSSQFRSDLLKILNEDLCRMYREKNPGVQSYCEHTRNSILTKGTISSVAVWYGIYSVYLNIQFD